MLITCSECLDAADLARLMPLIDALSWQDGARTAGSAAAPVKRNMQAKLSEGIGEKVHHILRDKVLHNPIVSAAALPLKSSKFIVSKTEAGGGYGIHTDNPFMRAYDDQTLRTDVSFTLFLSEPETYDGGELVIEHAGFTQSLKPKAGDLVLYPSTSLHQVAPVRSGVRLACIGWIESKIVSATDRELLFDLANLKAELSKTHAPQSPEMLTLAKIYSNLLRRLN